MSAASSAVIGGVGWRAATSIGRAARKGAKPACISALTDRAQARAALSAGHSPAWGKVSAKYSQIASESHTAMPACLSTGTLPEGECASACARVSGRRSATSVSRNGWPAILSASHGRNDQDDQALVPMTSSSSVTRGSLTAGRGLLPDATGAGKRGGALSAAQERLCETPVALGLTICLIHAFLKVFL